MKIASTSAKRFIVTSSNTSSCTRPWDDREPPENISVPSANANGKGAINGVSAHALVKQGTQSSAPTEHIDLISVLFASGPPGGPLCAAAAPAAAPTSSIKSCPLGLWWGARPPSGPLRRAPSGGASST